jgi:hypothetical protein
LYEIKTNIAVGVLYFYPYCKCTVCVGKWKTFDDETKEAKSIVEITERGGKIYGKVIEILNPAKERYKV